MKGGTLFSGIGAPELAAPGIDWRWCAETDPFASAVLDHHFGTENLGDVNEVDWDAVEPVDLIVFGSPCQSFSVAGKRLGLDDPRGNMALVGLRAVGRVRPRWVVFENVPGLLSSDDGKDFTTFLDAIEDLGYVIDVDILDAQYFGVPQRRRRIFVCGELASDIQQATTISSALTILQCLAESLALTLAVLRDRSGIAWGSCAFAGSDALLSLQRRMKLFGLDSPTTAKPVSMLEKSLAAILASSAAERNGSGLADGNDLTEIFRTATASASTRSHASTDGKTGHTIEFPNTGTSSSSILAASLRAMNECITSIAGNETIESKIFSCALMTLLIAERIIQSTRSSPAFWSAASSSLTALEEFTDYARFASYDLFTDVEWLLPWRNFIREAEPAIESLGNIGVENFGQIHVIAESLRGDLPPGRQAREGTPYAISPCVGASGRGFERTGDPRGQDCLVAYGGNTGTAVRRLTPTECEKLQGFPPGFTAGTVKYRPAADGPRYRALGNAMATPVVKWLLDRIQAL